MSESVDKKLKIKGFWLATFMPYFMTMSSSSLSSRRNVVSLQSAIAFSFQM